jgi:hypothetical protein
MDRDSLNWWLTLLANVGVLGGLVFVGFEIQQNTSQLRTDASYSITASVNELNAGLYGNPEFAEIVFRGEADLGALTPVERKRFDLFEFSRLNIAEYVQDLEGEGVSDLNFRYVEWIVREFQAKPGLRAFIREYEERYVGSDELLARLLGS